MSTTLQDLVKQRADLDAQIAAAKAAHFDTAMSGAVAILEDAGVALDEAAAALLTLHNTATRPKRNKRNKVAPKYRHRVTGATWTGRGKQPKWFAEAEQSEIEYLCGDLS